MRLHMKRYVRECDSLMTIWTGTEISYNSGIVAGRYTRQSYLQTAVNEENTRTLLPTYTRYSTSRGSILNFSVFQ